MILTGSICLSDIPKELFKKVECKDGSTKIYLNVAILERKRPSTYGHTHIMSCSPKQEERKDGVNYFCGDFKEYIPQPNVPTAEQIDSAPSVSPADDLPF